MAGTQELYQKHFSEIFTDSQPAPFRRYDGARLIELYHRPLEEGPAYDAVFAGPQTPPAPLNRASVSQLLYDSLAISAWKASCGKGYSCSSRAMAISVMFFSRRAASKS